MSYKETNQLTMSQSESKKEVILVTREMKKRIRLLAASQEMSQRQLANCFLENAFAMFDAGRIEIREVEDAK